MSDPDTNPPLTGTKDRPIERIPDAPNTLPDWAMLLGGPALWISHFMGVYLAAEIACGPLGPDDWTFFSGDSLVVITAVATAAAVVACAALAWYAHRRMRHQDGWTIDFASGGFLLSLGSMVGVLAVGAPALVLSPVC